MTFNVAQLLTSVAAATVAASTAAASSFSQCICEVLDVKFFCLLTPLIICKVYIRVRLRFLIVIKNKYKQRP